jgi:hypothetical protein
LDSGASEALDHLLKLEAPIEAVFEGGEIAFGVLRIAVGLPRPPPQ